MHTILVLTAVVATLSGMIILAMGEWRHFWLKHSAMFLSTFVSGAVALMLMRHTDVTVCTATDMMCANWFLYGIASNVRIILFHLAIGRDVLDYKKHGDRRDRGAVNHDRRNKFT